MPIKLSFFYIDKNSPRNKDKSRFPIAQIELPKIHLISNSCKSYMLHGLHMTWY